MSKELSGPDSMLFAREGFNIIATVNTRDRGVNEMSAALKRRFNFETVFPIPDPEVELGARLSGDEGHRVAEVYLAHPDTGDGAVAAPRVDLRRGRGAAERRGARGADGGPARGVGPGGSRPGTARARPWMPPGRGLPRQPDSS